MLKYLLLLLVLSACSNNPVVVNNDPVEESSDRELSANTTDSCLAAARVLLNSSADKFPGGSSQVLAFDESAFNNYFSKLSSKAMFDGFNDSFLRNELPAKTAMRLEKIRAKLEVAKDPMAAVTKLSPTEKRVVWFASVKPQLDAANEEILKELSQNGDEVSTLLLQLPRGKARNNAESAVTLMKRLDPEASADEIVREIRKRMSVCLR